MHEVPESDFMSLQQRLLQLIHSYLEGRGPKIVMTRLCVAMSNIVINGLPNLWQNPVENLVQIFQAEMEKRGVQVINQFV